MRTIALCALLASCTASVSNDKESLACDLTSARNVPVGTWDIS